MSDGEVLDVAIVGMGPSGLYTAWRLSKADHDQMIFDKPASKLRVALFDTMPEDRVGGRLCTQPLPGYPFLTELGGMRFRSTQRLIKGLVGALGLTDQIRPFNFDQHFYFLRGKKLLEDQFKGGATAGSPYNLDGKEQGRLPHELIEAAIHDTLKSLKFGPLFRNSKEVHHWGINGDSLIKKLKSAEGLHSLTAREWALIKRFGEYRGADQLSDVGFWDLLQFQLSSEGWHLAHDGLGYESIMGNWNASVALPWFLADFAVADAFTLENGMKSIPDYLYRAIKSTTDYSLYHNWDLTGIDLHPGSKESSERLMRLQFNIDDKSQSVLARAVVLALPKGALIRLNYDKELIAGVYGEELIAKPGSPDKQLDKRAWFFDLLNSVDGRPLFKLFLGYESPWWAEKRTSPVTGKVNTDLPLRQVYYYGQDQWNKQRIAELGISGNHHSHNNYSMLMASYSDSHYIEFWSELAKPQNWSYFGREGGRNKLSSQDKRVLDNSERRSA